MDEPGASPAAKRRRQELLWLQPQEFILGCQERIPGCQERIPGFKASLVSGGHPGLPGAHPRLPGVHPRLQSIPSVRSTSLTASSASQAARSATRAAHTAVLPPELQTREGTLRPEEEHSVLDKAYQEQIFQQISRVKHLSDKIFRRNR